MNQADKLCSTNNMDCIKDISSTLKPKLVSLGSKLTEGVQRQHSRPLQVVENQVEIFSQFKHHNLKKDNEIRCCIDHSVPCIGLVSFY